RPAVQEHGTRPAVGRVAPDVGAGEAQHVPQQVDQEEPGLDLGLLLFAVDRQLDQHGSHLHVYAPRRARASAGGADGVPTSRPRATAGGRAGAVSPRPRSRWSPTEPRRSALGWAAAAASSEARRMAASSGRFPTRAASARSALIGVGPTLVSPMPTRAQVPSAP